MEQIEDRDLIQQIRAGNERAFAVLIHRHSRRVYAHVLRLVLALGILENDEMVLEFRGALKAIVFLAPNQPHWKGLLMPLRLVSTDKEK